MATLVITSGQLEGRRIEVSRELVIGRENVDVEIDDAELSRRHFAVRPKAAGSRSRTSARATAPASTAPASTGPRASATARCCHVGHDHVRRRGAAGGSPRAAPARPAPTSPQGTVVNKAPPRPRARRPPSPASGRRRAGASPRRPAPAPAAAAPATAASNETAQPFGRYQATHEQAAPQGRDAAVGPAGADLRAVLGTAAGLVLYFAEH